MNIPLKMQVQVTQEDIQGAGRTALDNPIARALERVTFKRWNIFNGNVAYELSPPHRVLRLPAVMIGMWTSYQESGQMMPFEFEMELEYGAAPQQRRRNADRRASDRRRRDRRASERRASGGERRASGGERRASAGERRASAGERRASAGGARSMERRQGDSRQQRSVHAH